MKKMLSILLAAVMLVSAVPTAFAADYTQGTQVEYIATGTESYTITVPAKLNPGQEGTVTLAGTWADNRVVTVTAEENVTLTNSILASDQKVLKVTFDGISEKGNNIQAQTFTEAVSVAGISDALFGTWSGKFNYNVDAKDVTKIVPGLYKTGTNYSEMLQDWNSLIENELIFVRGKSVSAEGTENEDDNNGYVNSNPAAIVGDLVLPYDGSVGSVDWTGFYNCDNITSLVIQGGITIIGESGVQSCDGLTNVVLEGVKDVDFYSFHNCNNLTKVVLSNTLVEIDSDAFTSCENLTSITFNGTMAQWYAIDKSIDWCDDTLAEIVCSDGTVLMNCKENGCIDTNTDSYCDKCGEHKCVDNDFDIYCDVCDQHITHTDIDLDHWCDDSDCGGWMECIDQDGNWKCDLCDEYTCYLRVDTDNNHKCDICGQEVSECKDYDNDYICDICSKNTCYCWDDNYDGKCDTCGRPC